MKPSELIPNRFIRYNIYITTFGLGYLALCSLKDFDYTPEQYDTEDDGDELACLSVPDFPRRSLRRRMTFVTDAES